MDGERLRRAVWRRPWASVEEAVGAVAAERDEPVYVVGGYLRDLLLERPARDLDLVVVGDGLAFAGELATRLGLDVETTPRFLTARLDLPVAGRLDLSTARRESYPAPGALPEVEASSIEEDVARRDFTVNSFALGLAGPVGPGLLAAPGARRDLAAGRLRVLHPGSFVDDPTRILRGAALEPRLDFRLEPETEGLARRLAAGDGFAPVSGARLWQELEATLGSADAASVLERLDDLGALAAIFPGLRFGPEDRQRLERATAIVERLYPGGEGSEADRRRAAALVVLGLVVLGWRLDADARRGLAERLALPGAMRRALLGRSRRIAESLAGREEDRPSELHAELAGLSIGELAVVGAELGEAGRLLVRREVEEWRPLRLTIGAADLVAHGGAAGAALGRALGETLEARLDGRIGPDEELDHALTVMRAAEDAQSRGGTS